MKAYMSNFGDLSSPNIYFAFIDCRFVFHHPRTKRLPPSTTRGDFSTRKSVMSTCSSVYHYYMKQYVFRSNHIYIDYIMLIYWDTDLNKSVYFFLNPICILLVVCTRQLLFVS